MAEVIGEVDMGLMIFTTFGILVFAVPVLPAAAREKPDTLVT